MFKRLFGWALIAAFGAVLVMGATPASAETGIVVLHGKGGKNLGKAPTKILARVLEEKGFLVAAPDMPWQADRIFDKTLDEAMTEIDGIVADLKSRGADKIVIAGHSLGANVAIAYGARREGLAGIAAMAPGHVPEVWGGRIAGDLARAREMVAAGKGGEKADFDDFNQGRTTTYSLTANIYLSWYDPDGDAVIPKNAAKLKPGTPLLWIVGEQDRMAERGETYAFAKAPPHPKSSYQVIGGGHKATPKKGRKEILQWLKGL